MCIRDSLVVVPLNECAAAGIAHALLLGGLGLDVEGGSAGGAHPAAAHALLDLAVGDLDGDHMVKHDAGLVQGLGLGQGAGHAVQDKALGTVGLLQPLGHDADDHGIGDQLACVHIGLGLKAHGLSLIHI